MTFIGPGYTAMMEKWNWLIRSTLGASSLVFLLSCSWPCFAADQAKVSSKRSEHTIKTSRLDFGTASRLISANSMALGKIGFSAELLDPEKNHLFSVSAGGEKYLVVPVSRESKQGIAAFTCSILLFTEAGGLIGAVDTLGSGEARPWTCGGVTALAFADLYSDGSLGIILIYEGTAPSSERFQLPIVLKANLARITFVVDEQKTDVLVMKNVKTIKATRNFLR